MNCKRLILNNCGNLGMIKNPVFYLNKYGNGLFSALSCRQRRGLDGDDWQFYVLFCNSLSVISE